MIGKKWAMWIGASLFSAAAIPALGKTIVHHHRLHASKKSAPHVAVMHVQPAVKKLATKPTTLIAAHTLKTSKHAKTSIKSGKSTTGKKPSTSTIGVLAMHSGRTTADTAQPKPVTHHLLTATSKVKMH